MAGTDPTPARERGQRGQGSDTDSVWPEHLPLWLRAMVGYWSGSIRQRGARIGQRL